jgi:hypothetical protein
MMSCISEAWEIMNKHMGMKYDDIGKVFEEWSTEGELVGLSPSFSIPAYKDSRKTPSSSKSAQKSARKRTNPETTFSATCKTNSCKTSTVQKGQESGPTRKQPLSTSPPQRCQQLITYESCQLSAGNGNTSLKHSTVPSCPQSSHSPPRQNKMLSSRTSVLLCTARV